MYRLTFILLFYLFLSSCGNANDIFDEIEYVQIDSILIDPPTPNDSTNTNHTDTIINGNGTITPPKDTIISDSLCLSNHQEIEYTPLFKLTSTSKNEQQGIAIYDKYLFNCHHSNDIIDVFDLEAQKKVASISLEPETIVHCNNVNFGPEFYNNKDKFPLLYVQQRGYACKLNVYRIICNGDSITGAKKVQTISFESCSSCINTIDIKRNLLYAIYGMNGNSYISSFKMPSVKDGDISIHPKTALKTYYSPYKKIGQDTAFDNNYLYLLCGYSKEGELWRINLDNKTAKLIDFTEYGLYGEPEGIDIYNNDIYVSFLNTPLYKMVIIE